MWHSTINLKTIRYKGVLLLQEHNKSWLVHPERSPLLLLPFRIQMSGIEEVKAKLDLHLSHIE